MNEAFILAGGKGTRLRPFTATIPKPLLPLGDKSIISVILAQLEKFDFSKVHISVGYLSYLIEASIMSQRASWKFEIDFIHEDKPLGTAGALSKVYPESEELFVINGDTLSDISFSNLMQYHRDRKSGITIASHKRSVKIEYGVLLPSQTMDLLKYQEKPVLEYLVSMGIYVIRTDLLSLIPKDTYVDFPTFTINAKEKGHRVSLYEYSGYWRDLGNLGDIEEATEDYLANPDRFV